jgi:hypothetical protein
MTIPVLNLVGDHEEGGSISAKYRLFSDIGKVRAYDPHELRLAFAGHVRTPLIFRASATPLERLWETATKFVANFGAVVDSHRLAPGSRAKLRASGAADRSRAVQRDRRGRPTVSRAASQPPRPSAGLSGVV